MQRFQRAALLQDLQHPTRFQRFGPLLRHEGETQSLRHHADHCAPAIAHQPAVHGHAAAGQPLVEHAGAARADWQ
ncbi:hypothetical protein D3C72_2072110 [compost metagenome]